jgi:two-component system, chemotaxis family, protein-glutamate methylesterase/glutaminase
MINVLIADDSGFMRLMIKDMLSEADDMEVLEAAQDGEDAYQKTLALNPDVIILDLVMEKYDGLYAVKKIMANCPKPIIILSSLGNVNPQSVVEALEAGAYDFVNKPEGAYASKVRNVKQQLINKIRYASRIDVSNLKKKVVANNHAHTFDTLHYQILVIGASTGGTNAIESILKKLPQNFPIPILVVQHIPSEFGYSFAKRLNEETPFEVKIAQHKEPIQNGKVYVSPSDTNMKIVYDDNTHQSFCYFTNQQFDAYNHPSVDCLMLSVAEAYQSKTLGVILTGMGKDGTLGMKKIHELGGYTIAQDEKTSVVFGMPQSAIHEGAIQQTLPLDEIPNFIVGCL